MTRSSSSQTPATPRKRSANKRNLGELHLTRGSRSAPAPGSLAATLAAARDSAINGALARAGGNRAAAARELGITARTIFRALAERGTPARQLAERVRAIQARPLLCNPCHRKLSVLWGTGSEVEPVPTEGAA